MKTLRSIAATLALFLGASIAFAQTATISGRHVLNSTGGPLASGSVCVGSSNCVAVTNGVVATGSTVPTGVSTITLKDASGTVYWTLPGVTVSAGFNFDAIVIGATQTLTLTGQPYTACAVGAQAVETSTTPNTVWTCGAFNGRIAWQSLNGGSSSARPSGYYGGAGAPAFACQSPCLYVRTDAAAGAAFFATQGAPGVATSTWIQQAQGPTGPQGPQGPAGPSGSGSSSGAVGNPGDTQIAGPSGSVTSSDATTKIFSLPVQEYVTTTHPQLAYWGAAFHNCQNQIANVAIHGDSRSVVTTTMAPGSLDIPFGKRWVDQYRTQLWGDCPIHALGVPFKFGAGSQAVMPDYYTLSGSFTADAALGPYQGGNVADAMLISTAADNTVITFTPGIAFDHLNCYGVTGPGLNSWTMSVDGNTVGTCGGSGSTKTAVLATSSAVALATHSPVSITCTTHPCEAYMLEVTAGSVGVGFYNFSVGSCAAECFGLAPSTQFAFSDLVPGGWALDVLNLIANEPGVGYSTTSFQTSLNNIITHDRGMSYPPSVMLISPLQDGIGGQTAYYPIILSTAQTLNTAFGDMRDKWGPNVVGFMEGPDNFHENSKGHGELYSMVAGTTIDVPTPAIAIPNVSCSTGKAITGFASGQPVCSNPNPVACGVGYAHYAPLTIAHTEIVGGTSLTDFPILLGFNGATSNSITLANIATTSNGGQVTSSTGVDVQFCSAATAGSLLSYEKVSYTASSGAGEWYVKVPSLSASTDTTIYMFWGNSGVADTSQAADVWSNNYSAVYHMVASAYTADSTGHGQTLGLASGVGGASSPVGGGLSFAGNNYAAAASGGTIPTGAASRTIEAWQQYPSTPGGENIAFGYGGNGNAFSIDEGAAANQYGVWIISGDSSLGGQLTFNAGTTWHHYAWTLSSPGTKSNVAAFIDGGAQSVSCANNCSSAYGTPAGTIQINGIPGAGATAGGSENVAEFRISSVARSAGWIGTQYANQVNPNTFFAVGTIH